MPNRARKQFKTSSGFLVRRLQQISVSIFIDSLRAFGITPMQYTVLRIVQANPGIDQISVAKLAVLDTSTATDVIIRLTQKGLLTRSPSETDRRIRELRMTEAGDQLLADSKASVSRARQLLLAPIPPADRKQFLHHLQKLVDGHNAVAGGDEKPWKRGKRPAKAAAQK